MGPDAVPLCIPVPHVLPRGPQQVTELPPLVAPPSVLPSQSPHILFFFFSRAISFSPTFFPAADWARWSQKWHAPSPPLGTHAAELSMIEADVAQCALEAVRAEADIEEQKSLAVKAFTMALQGIATGGGAV